MTKDELLTRLKGFEWNDVEFKLAQRGVPDNSYETVSAFANTSGGWLVFGVRENTGAFSIEGVVEVDKVQGDFLSTLRSRQKLNREISVTETAIEHNGAHVLAFYVPESLRGVKPVYLKGDIRQSFIRRGGGDERCTPAEIERMLRDASATRYDAETLDLDPTRCFDEASIRWYRTAFNRAKPGTDESVDDLTFLHNWGFVVEQHGKLVPTRAAVLLFGADAYLRQTLPRMVVDFQFYNARDYDPEIRWADRLQAEENLIKTWQAVSGFFFKHSERPFSIDAVTLRRSDDPPDYVSFREAAINLLIHQDFGDHTRLPVIRLFRNQSEFFNPGDAFATREQLIDPGDKEVRNPTIVSAFRRIGLSDQGGTGVVAIFAGSRKQGYMPPVIDNNKAEKSFRLRLPKERLLTLEQVMLQASLGVNLSDHEKVVFAYLTRKGRIDITDVKGLTGLNGPDAITLVQRLTAQVMVERVQEGGHLFTLAGHLRARFHTATSTAPERKAVGASDGDATVQATVQVTPNPTAQVPPLVQLSVVQWSILNHADNPRKLQELMQVAGYKQRAFFKATHLEPLLAAGVLRMTVPDKPRSSNQQYVLTEAGVKLKALHGQAEPAQIETKTKK